MRDAIEQLSWFVRNSGAFWAAETSYFWSLAIVLATIATIVVPLMLKNADGIIALVGPVLSAGFGVFYRISEGIKKVRKVIDDTMRQDFLESLDETTKDIRNHKAKWKHSSMTLV